MKSHENRKKRDLLDDLRELCEEPLFNQKGFFTFKLF